MSNSLLVLAGLCLLGLSGCAPAAPLPTTAALAPTVELPPPPTPPVTPPGAAAAATLPPPAVRPASPTSPATAAPPTAAVFPAVGLRAAGGVPAAIVAYAHQVAAAHTPEFAWLEPGQNLGQQELTLMPDAGAPLADWLYVVAAPFATVPDSTTLAEVQSGWQSGLMALGRLVLDADTAAVFAARWGPLSAGVSVVAPEELPGALWAARPSWTILPFDRLAPELKLLRLDGLDPLSWDFDLAGYPLRVSVGVEGAGPAVARLRALWDAPGSNYRPQELTRIAMTGVTALGRATAYQMELQGVTAPGRVVGPIMQAADIAHVSHEVAFAPDCPYPNPVGDPVFCARDAYLELITSIGTDVVELTGNHVNDWGAQNLVHTLDLYAAAGLQIFGGGRDLTEAARPAVFEHNGNRIAFVGCNPVGPAYAWATATGAGSRPCDYAAFHDQIRDLADQGYLVIATLQYAEFYHYPPTAQQTADFRAVAGAGAAAVSGSQGHHAQGFDFHGGAFIHYGLGNLFFDQMDMLGTRQSFVDLYTVYGGRLLNVELFTGLIENYCCPRATTDAERAQLLQAVFQASGW